MPMQTTFHEPQVAGPGLDTDSQHVSAGAVAESLPHQRLIRDFRPYPSGSMSIRA